MKYTNGESGIYFDNSATTHPKPRSVYKAADIAARTCGNPGRSGHPLAREADRIVYNAREDIAELFNAEPQNVIFTENATHALNLAIKGLICGDVVISDIEHNAVVRPAYEITRRQGNKLKIFKTKGSDGDILSSLSEQIDKNTSLVVATAMSNLNGKTLPIYKIGELCKKMGISYIIDGSQLAGHLSFDFSKSNADAFCAPSHKGLFGLMGSGICILKGDKALNTLIEGGNGVDSALPEMGEVLPERYEGGTLPVSAIASLSAGVRFIKDVSIEGIEEKERILSIKAIETLSSFSDIIIYKAENISPVIAFNINGFASEEVCSYLSYADIYTRGGLHCAPLAHDSINTNGGAVRISFSYFNEIKQIDKLYRALKELNIK